MRGMMHDQGDRMSELPIPKHHRVTQEVRREALIRATLDCLAEAGSDGASVRKIAARANVSIGLINHYFAGIEALVAEAYRLLATELLDSIEKAVEDAGTEPRAKISAFFRQSFAPPNLDYKVLHVWIAFWSMTRRSHEVQSIHDETYGAYRTVLEGLLGALKDQSGDQEISVRLAAIGLSALIDGLWLEWCLNQKTFSPDEAIRLCEAWVESLITVRSGR